MQEENMDLREGMIEGRIAGHSEKVSTDRNIRLLDEYVKAVLATFILVCHKL